MYQTHHQKELLALFREHPEEPFTAIRLMNIFQTSMNKATIYRRLKALEENKIIRKSYNPNKKCYEYQYSLDCGNHLHLVCKECGRITHLTCKESKSFIEHLLSEHSFFIDNSSTILFGKCKECGAHA